MHGPVPGAVTWGGASFHVLRPCARSKVIVKHENHPLVVEATLVSNLGPISWLLTIMRAINGILFGFAGRLIYYICDIVHRQLPLLLDMEVRVSQLLLLPGTQIPKSAYGCCAQGKSAPSVPLQCLYCCTRAVRLHDGGLSGLVDLQQAESFERSSSFNVRVLAICVPIFLPLICL